MRLYALLVTLTIGILAIACVPIQKERFLPTPEADCPIIINWRGIIPGQSTQRNVTDALGHPSQRGVEQFGEQRIPFYSYPVEGGVVADYVQDRIFFRSDGTVNWIEVVVADRDGTFHIAQETIDQLGNTLDTVYMNNNYNPSNSFPIDVLAGPDQIYIWSECGLALSVLATCSVSDSDKLRCTYSDDVGNSEDTTSTSLVLRYPNPHSSSEPIPDVNNVVLMKFLFSPTSYDGFDEFYRYNIPFGIWDIYLHQMYAD